MISKTFIVRRAARTAFYVVTLISLACSDTRAPTATEPAGPATPSAASPFFVSNPVGGGAARSVYVALPPGSMPNAQVVTIRVASSGLSATVIANNGGLDPVAVPAHSGDTLTIGVQFSDRPTISRFLATVPVTAPPRIVRTVPAEQQQYVPLNTSLLIVFSEPVDAALIVDPSSVQLRSGATTVAGQLTFTDSTHVAAAFTPLAPLAPATGYALMLATTIRDIDGSALDSARSVPFTTVAAPTTGFAMVSAGGVHTCALTLTGAAYCWGNNESGALGNGTTTGSTVPVPVGGGIVFKSISAGWLYTCGVATDAAAYCWGLSTYGELGNGTLLKQTSPVRVSGGLSFASVSAGDFHACGVTLAGAAYCWGFGYDGELGVDSTAKSTCVLYRDVLVGDLIDYCETPTPVAGGLTYASVSAGSYGSCGVTTSGRAYCWGANTTGELGAGDTIGTPQCVDDDYPTYPTFYSCSHAPVAVAGGLTFRVVSAGNGSACGIAVNGEAFCWGADNKGQLGNAITANGVGVCVQPVANCSAIPQVVAGGLAFTTLAAGDHACGVTPAGAAVCWGDNSSGALGNGTYTTVAMPVPVIGGSGLFSMVSAGPSTNGSSSTCGVGYDGSVYCWGNNDNGQLGNGTTTASALPVRVLGPP